MKLAVFGMLLAVRSPAVAWKAINNYSIHNRLLPVGYKWLSIRCSHPSLPTVISRSYSAASSDTAANNIDHSYSYIDSGEGWRLESFSDVIVRRSCPTAVWPQRCQSQWRRDAHLIHSRPGNGKSPEAWQGLANYTLSDQWSVSFPLSEGTDISFSLRKSEMGQVGVFPEQLSNWRYVYDLLTTAGLSRNAINILNGFAYTGGSTLACLAANKVDQQQQQQQRGQVQVTHLDASKTSIDWARANLIMNGVTGSSVRFIQDDCLTFIEREIRRGKRYDGVILDPPAFGRFQSKNWKLERDFDFLLSKLPQLLSEEPLFVVLSCHDVNWSAERLGVALERAMTGSTTRGVVSAGELTLLSESQGNNLPLGVFARWSPIPSN